MSDRFPDPTPDVPAADEVAPDMVAPLGAVAYGVFVLDEAGPLEDIATLSQSIAARIPAQEGRSLDRDHSQDNLLDELGALDL